MINFEKQIETRLIGCKLFPMVKMAVMLSNGTDIFYHQIKNKS